MAFFRSPVGAKKRRMQGIQQVCGPLQSSFSSVEAMVVGGEQYVESGILDRIQEFIGSAERRVASVRFAAQCYFQVADGDVCLADFCLYVLEAVRIVVAFAGLGCLYLRIVLHQVTNK